MIIHGEISALPFWLSSKLDNQKLPKCLNLSTWEYYVFFFAAYGVGLSRGWKGCQPQPVVVSTSSPELDGSIWNNVFKTMTSISKKEMQEQRDERIEGSSAYSYLYEEYMRFFVHCSFMLPNSSITPTSYLDQEFYSVVRSDYPTISSTILQPTLDFWLNSEASIPSLPYVVPDELIVECLIIGLKALMRGLKTIRAEEPNLLSAEPITAPMRSRSISISQEELFNQILFNSIRYPLFQFLSRTFEYKYWKVHTIRILKYIVQIWIMCIRPWDLSLPSWMNVTAETAEEPEVQFKPERVLKYFSTMFSGDAQHKGTNRYGYGGKSSGGSPHISGKNPPSQHVLEQARREYVASYFLLYTPLLTMYLHRDIDKKSKKEMKILYSILEPWSASDLLDPVLEVDAAIEAYHNAEKRYETLSPQANFLALTALDAVGLCKQLIPSPLRWHTTANIAAKIFHNMESIIMSSSNKELVSLAGSCKECLAQIFNFDRLSKESPPIAPIDFGGVEKPYKKRRVPAHISIRDAQYRGDSRLQPITSTESAFLVRSAYKLSLYLKKRYSVDLDLRLIGSLRIYAWVAVMSVFVLLMMGIWSLITLDWSWLAGDSHDHQSNFQHPYLHRHGGFH